MTQLESQAVQFMKRLESAYLEQRDMETVIAALDEEVSWIGTGQQDICENGIQARALLAREKERFQGSFVLLDTHYTAQQLNDALCLVRGRLSLREKAEGQPAFLMRVSALCILRGGQFKLYHLHLSTPSTTQQGGEFPKPLQEEEESRLRHLLQDRSAELAKRQQDYDFILSSLPGGVFCCDTSPALNLRQYSDGFLKMLGYTREEIETLFGGRFAELILPEDLQQTVEEVERQLQKGNTKQIEYRVRRKDGTAMWVLDRGQLVKTADSEALYYCILLDNTQQKKAEDELRLSLERFRIIMDQTNDIIFEWDMSADTLMVSANWEKTFGYSPLRRQVRERILGGRIHPEDRATLGAIMADMEGGVAYSTIEMRIQKVDGNYLWCRIRATLQRDEKGRPSKAIGVIIDIDQQKREHSDLERQAKRDSLTGLYNKGAAQNFVNRDLRHEAADRQYAYLIIDLDNFKFVNDRYGHLSGDTLLVDFAHRLLSLFRADDIVSRIGGDEFSVWMRGVKGSAIVKERARSVLEEARGLLEEQGIEEAVTCSIGIAMAPQDGADFYTLYKKADLALYHVKSVGKANFAFYEGAFAVSALIPGENYESVSERIDSDRRAVHTGDRLLREVSALLFSGEEPQKILPLALELVGRAVDVSRVYIFENSPDGGTFSNTYEWCHGVSPEKDTLQDIPIAELEKFYSNIQSEGIYYSKDVRELPPAERALLERQGVKSILQSAIRSGDGIIGMMGFDECRQNRVWTQEQVDLLAEIAKIVGVYLSCDHMSKRLRELTDKEMS